MFRPSRFWSVVLPVMLVLSTSGSLAADPPPDVSRLRATIRMAQTSYEADQVIRGELTLENLQAGWSAIPPADALSRALTVVDAAGKVHEAVKPEQFAAVKAKELGPGGFVGIAFDAALLFPVLRQPGSYTLRFEAAGVSASTPLRVIAGFDATRNYRLTLNTTSGEITIALDAAHAPVAARNIVNLARLGFFDGASIPVTQNGELVMVRGPVTAQHRIVPAELSREPVLAGAVVLEPSLQPGAPRGSWPNLTLLLTPRPQLTGQAVVIGRVVSGIEVVGTISNSPNSGPQGQPPFSPLAPLFVRRATITEAVPEATEAAR